jgi:hypothetical protein
MARVASLKNGNPLEDIDLQTLVADIPVAIQPYHALFLEHGTIKGDICILFMFDKPQASLEGSELALGLKEVLRDAGLVSYKIWIETACFPMSADNDVS